MPRDSFCFVPGEGFSLAERMISKIYVERNMELENPLSRITMLF